MRRNVIRDLSKWFKPTTLFSFSSVEQFETFIDSISKYDSDYRRAKNEHEKSFQRFPFRYGLFNDGNFFIYYGDDELKNYYIQQGYEVLSGESRVIDLKMAIDWLEGTNNGKTDGFYT